MKKFDINSIKIAKPCGVGWDSMTGDGKIRHCDLCELNVYNTEAMTESEVTRLLSKPNGRVCGRIRRRADGTLITRDCPKGIRDYGKRMTHLAGVALSAVLAMFSVSYGQTSTAETEKNKPQSTSTVAAVTGLEGIVADQTGAVIPGATIQINRENSTEVVTMTTNEVGKFSFTDIPAGIYEIDVSYTGFKRSRLGFINVEENSLRSVKIELEYSEDTVVVGIFFDREYSIDFGKTDISTTIYPRPER